MGGLAGPEQTENRSVAKRAKRWVLGLAGAGASGGLVAGAAALPLPLWGALAVGVAVMIPLTVITVAWAIVIVHHASPGATVGEVATAIAVVIFALLPFGQRPETLPTDRRPENGDSDG